MRDDLDYKFFLNGEWKVSSSGIKIPIKNPYNNDLVGYIQACTKEEVNQAVKNAKENIECWENTPIKKRAEILKNAANLMNQWANYLGELLMKENGKPLNSAISEIKRTALIFDATAEAKSELIGTTMTGDIMEGASKEKISITYRVPLGVVLCIGPFNYPFNLTGSKIAPALLAGNTVVMKPPTEGSITASHFGVILQKAGVPSGVFNIITGRGSEIGDFLISHPEINMINFTGSSETGKHLAKIAGMKPLLLELGGKDAAIVLNDADINNTVKSIVSGAFSYNGQRCTAVKRVLPMPDIADILIEKVVEETKKLTIGDPSQNRNIGPLINSKQCDYVQELIADAIKKGAEVKYGNKREGNIIWPTILDKVTTDMRIAWEEQFGPIVPFIRVKTIEEAIEISNKSEYGLQGMIFTNNIDLALNIAQELDVGTIQINGQSSRGPDHFPFIGTKASGMGTQGIKYSILNMSRPKVVVMNLSEKGKLIRFCNQ
ncbi:MAG: NADP-dependent glyceraldehyde-3-phosphate dehydrogenase [Candidatus Lokiarchaeota archaeon]|nr:NADP-dependent glyceraldehyde-3-phosphate dehydrogenase [Candidatus Lokiarchaeota archaeon]